MKNRTGSFFASMGLALLGTVLSAQAIPVRIASYNVLFGIDTGSDRTNALPTDDYAAVQATFQRVQPDIVCFQELSFSDKAAWLQMAATLGYQYYAFASTTGGTFAGEARLGIWSKYPILASSEVKETVVDSAAKEMTRWPLHAIIQVPGALQPFHVFSVHNKSGTTDKTSRLRRAFEMHRLLNYVTNLIAQYPLDSEYAIMGDFNDTIEGSVGLGQTTNFPKSYYQDRLAAGALGSTYNDGFDIPWNNATNAGWLMPYRYYPTDRLGELGMVAVPAAHTGGTNNWTHDNGDGLSGYRLDYILFSDEIANNAYGPPAAEVYASAGDGVGVGLTKYGSPLPTNTSAYASDHRLVFADFNLIDEVGGITPVGILSEIVDHPTSTNGNYVEICNTGIGTLDLSAYKVAVYLDKNRNAATNVALSGTLDSGQVYTLAASTGMFAQIYAGKMANKQSAIVGQLNGNDVVALVRSNSVSDIYGKTRADPAGWGYTNATAVRKQGVSDPATTWTNVEWTIAAGTNAATPGAHASLPPADVSVSGAGLSPFAPKATNAFAVQASVFRNRAATNLAVTAKFRINGGNWITNAMTNSSGYVWQTPPMDVAKNGGDVMEYAVQVSFWDYYGASSNSPKSSATNVYTFPAGTGTTARLLPLFNEIQANGAGADTNEFVELIAPAGTNLVGYSMRHYNGAANLDGVIWTYTFPSFVVPDDGIVNQAGNPLGLVVVAQSSNAVANADLILGYTLNNGPNALILYDPASNIVDAAVWLAATTNVFDTDVDDPGTVSRLVPGGSPSYLHVVGVDQDTDFCPQAPNNVLMATGTWVSALATPGTLNASQTNGFVIVSRLDLDQDGVLDDEDNCLGTFNPTQLDMDGDGLGDECDGDIDGDGVPNEIDNCPYAPNPGQEDMDLDGIGDACDSDVDGDGLPNEDDPDPFTPSTLIVDFESPTNLSKTVYATLTPEQIEGRYWVLSNAVVGTTASDLRKGAKSLRLRAPGEFVLQGALTNGIGTLSYAYGRYGADAGITVKAEYDAGAGWVEIASVSSAGVTTLTTNSATVNVLGPVNLRFTCAGTTDLRANVDDVTISEFTLPNEELDALCALVATNEAVYDGYAHTNDFIVYPEGIRYSVAYAPTNPVGVGTYAATVTIPDTNLITGGTFVFTDSVVIARGAATCELVAPIAAPFDGQPHTNAFAVTPGMAWSVAYAPTNPVEPGSYAATVTVASNANAAGGIFTFTNAVVISRAPASCEMGPRIVADYDGLPRTNVFTVTTGLAWSVTYSPEHPPVNAGVYSATVAIAGDARWTGTTNVYVGAVAIQTTSAVARTVAASPFVMDFESPYAPNGTYGPYVKTLAAASPSNWYVENAYLGTLSNDVKNGVASLRLRYIGAAAPSNGVLQSATPFAGIHSVAFNYAMYGTDSAATLALQTSINGYDWTNHANLVVTGIRTNFAAFSNTLALTKARFLRFQLVAGTALQKVNLDDVSVMAYEALPATVVLGSLAQTYDARPKRATATTVPAGLAVAFTYNGATNLPVAIGNYTVVGTVVAPDCAGSATGTLVVSQAAFAPWFNPPDSQAAYVGLATSFVVSANGDPAPTLALQGTTASSGYGFTAGTGALAYVAPQADLGNRTFTFTASNSSGVATQTVSVAVNQGPPAAPTAIWAGATNNSGFTATWSAVANATGYRLDVATSALFDGSVAGQFVRASNPAVSATPPADWAYNVSGSSSTYLILGYSSNSVVSEAFSTLGFTNLTVDFRARTYGGTARSNVVVSLSTNNGATWSALATVNPASGSTWVTIPTITNAANLGFAQTRIRWQAPNAAGNVGVGISNLVVQGWSVAAEPAYVAGWSNQTASGTSQTVTDLASGSTYFFRVRAVSAGGTGPDSATATVTTKAGTPPLLDPIDAQTATVAADFDHTVAALPTDADPVTYACTSAVSASVWLFDTNSGYFYFLPGTNQIGENVFVFTALDKDGASSPAAMTVTVGTTPFVDWVMGKGQDPGSSNYATNSDVDGDGMNTWQEYLADTDPAASGSVLRLTGTYVRASASNATGKILFSFPASTGRYYQLIIATNLMSPLITSNLGWGIPGMAVTNDTLGAWYGDVRVLLTEP